MGMTIGTIEHARAALSGFLTYLGGGADRMAYRDDDVVYKVCRHFHPNAQSHDMVNRREADNFTRIARMPDIPELFAIPEFTLWELTVAGADRAVMALPYISGYDAGYSMPDDVATWLGEKADIYDIVNENVRFCEFTGLYFLVDGGE